MTFGWLVVMSSKKSPGRGLAANGNSQTVGSLNAGRIVHVARAGGLTSCSCGNAGQREQPGLPHVHFCAFGSLFDEGLYERIDGVEITASLGSRSRTVAIDSGLMGLLCRRPKACAERAVSTSR